MKKFLRTLGLISLILLVAYAGYLVYQKFFLEKDDIFDDLEDDYDETFEDEIETVPFSERVKAAAERQLEKVR